MLPFLTVFGKQIPMYGLMMVTGAFFAILFACLRAKKRRLEPMDVLICSIFFFLRGSHLCRNSFNRRLQIILK